jgi:hypothetical protein
MSSKEFLFKIIFFQRDHLYEIYARQVSESDMYGFIVVEEIVFGEKSHVVLDPSEERIKAEFQDVTRTYIPMHAVLRIDEVERQGTAKVVKLPSGSSNVSPFPGMSVNDKSSG